MDSQPILTAAAAALPPQPQPKARLNSQQQQQKSLAKSVDQLSPDSSLIMPTGNMTGSKINLNHHAPPPLPPSDLSRVARKIDLQSQKEINNILMANSRTMTLSKSIKDMRLYVSNSFSPSQIVKPPPMTITTTTTTANEQNGSTSSTSSTSSSPAVSGSSTSSSASLNNNNNQQQQLQLKQKQTSSTHAPISNTNTTSSSSVLFSSQPGNPRSLPYNNNNNNMSNYENVSIKNSFSSNNKYEHQSQTQSQRPPLAVHTNLNTYKNAMLTPLKDEKSDQVRMEFLQQQQAIAHLKKQQLLEHQKQQQQQKSQVKTTTSGNLNPSKNNYPPRNDDDLINCILDMKPPVLNKNTNTSNYVNMTAGPTISSSTIKNSNNINNVSSNYQNQFYIDQQKQRHDMNLVKRGSGESRPTSRQVCSCFEFYFFGK